MAVQVFAFTITIPAGTTQATPQVTNLALPACIVQRIEGKVPAGPRGLMGFAFGASGVAILPYNAASWLVLDDEPFSFDLTEQISSGGWQFRGYNLGQFPHSVYVRFLTIPPGTGTAAGTLALVSSDALSSPAAPQPVTAA